VKLTDVETFEVGDLIARDRKKGLWEVVKVEDGTTGWRDGFFAPYRMVPMQRVHSQYDGGSIEQCPASECHTRMPPEGSVEVVRK
jgi:hypothetical protein